MLIYILFGGMALVFALAAIAVFYAHINFVADEDTQILSGDEVLLQSLPLPSLIVKETKPVMCNESYIKLAREVGVEV